jgi:hypothetical protein
MADAAYRQSLVAAAVIPVPDWTTAQFDDFMRNEIARSLRRSGFGWIKFYSPITAAAAAA